MEDINKSMLDQFQEIIKKNIPEQVGENLKKYLEEATENKKKLELLTIKNSDLEKDLSKVISDLNKANDLLCKHVSLETKLVEIDKRERNLKIMELEIKLVESEKRADGIQDLVSNLVRNTVFRRALHRSVSKDDVDQYGNNIKRLDDTNIDGVEYTE